MRSKYFRFIFTQGGGITYLVSKILQSKNVNADNYDYDISKIKKKIAYDIIF